MVNEDEKEKPTALEQRGSSRSRKEGRKRNKRRRKSANIMNDGKADSDSVRPPNEKQPEIAAVDPSCSSNKRRRKEAYPLKGMVLSVSTLSVRSNLTSESDNNSSSYQSVVAACKSLGATVSELVSKRVDAVVCTPEALQQATQRVRKAVKRNKPIVSVEWITACQQQRQRISQDEYRMEEEARGAVRQWEKGREPNEAATDGKNITSLTEGTGLEERTIELGCCCLCHEQGTTADCPWCPDCKE